MKKGGIEQTNYYKLQLKCQKHVFKLSQSFWSKDWPLDVLFQALAGTNVTENVKKDSVC